MYIYVYVCIYIYMEILEIYMSVYLIYIYIHRYIYIKFIHIYNIIDQLSSRVKSKLFDICNRPYLAPPISQFGLHS